MRTLLRVSVPTEAGNKALREGLLEKTVSDFLRSVKPEAAYFTTEDGLRTFYVFLDLPSTSDMVVMAEPFFTNLNASIWWAPVMNVEDLKAGLGKALKKS